MISKTSIAMVLMALVMLSCNQKIKAVKQKTLTAKAILGNPEYLAMAYGGYRETSRTIQPTIAELKEDMKILSAMGVKIVRTYNVQLEHAQNLLKAIKTLKVDDATFEMYVMLGAWIDCDKAWQESPNHAKESEANAAEIDRAVVLAKQYPDIVKIIAVGNEAMVKWAASYYVQPHVILKWVNHLQALKTNGVLPKELWVTSSDDFASWGGGDEGYKTKTLEQLIKAVDYVSMHTYPMHNTHYNPAFWKVPEDDEKLNKADKVEAAMQRALQFAKMQYQAVSEYVKNIDSTKQIHVGETGWATKSNGFYGAKGSRATDEYKAGRYFELIRQWTNTERISCFYFEAFDEQWKDAENAEGSENHFGLITLKGEAKYGLWNAVDQGQFKGLTRHGVPITKTFKGDKIKLEATIGVPPMQHKDTN